MGWSDSERDTHTHSPPQCNASMSQDLSGLIFFKPKWVCAGSPDMGKSRGFDLLMKVCACSGLSEDLILLSCHGRIIVAWWNKSQKWFSYRSLRLSLFFTATFPSVKKPIKLKWSGHLNGLKKIHFSSKKTRMGDLSLAYLKGVP